MAAMILALNRCLGLVSRVWSDRLFEGGRTWLWLLFAVLYGVHHDFYSKAAIFSGVIGCWHFNPHVGYLEDLDHNVRFAIIRTVLIKTFQYSALDLLKHNVVVLVSLTVLYGTFCLRIMGTKRGIEGGNLKSQLNVKAVRILFGISLFRIVNGEI